MNIVGEKTHYTAVGLSVLILFISAIVVFLWLSVGFDKISYRTYLVYMNEPVNGLSAKSIVKFNGVDVGLIKKISLNNKNPKQVILLIKVNEKTPITTGTIAILESQGLTGLRYLELHTNQSSIEPLKRLKGEAHPIIPSKPSLFVEMSTILTDVTTGFKQMSEVVNLIIDKDNALSIKSSLKNISGFTAVLSEQSKALSQIITNFDLIAKNSANASKELPTLMKTVTHSGKSMSRMSDFVSKSMGKAVVMIEQINNQTLPKAHSLMTNLNELTRELKGVSKELKRNPSMLIRGKSQRTLGPGE